MTLCHSELALVLLFPVELAAAVSKYTVTAPKFNHDFSEMQVGVVFTVINEQLFDDLIDRALGAITNKEEFKRGLINGIDHL